MTAHKPKRRRFQFSLRTLIAFVLVVGTACGLLGRMVREVWLEKIAVGELRKFGASVQYWQEEEQRASRWLAGLLGADCPPVVAVQLTGARVTDAAAGHLAALTELQKLGLGHTSATDDGLKHLSQLTKLQTLDLGHTAVTDDGLKHLGRLTRLQTLDLGHTQIAGPGLKSLQNLAGLQRLNLGYTPMTDEGLMHLKGMPRLQSLCLDGTAVTDAGLRHLGPRTGLKELYLYGTNVTGAGLEHLKGMAALVWLDLDLQVAAAAVNDLQTALPKLHIHR